MHGNRIVWNRLRTRGLCLFILLSAWRGLRADVGLIVETPTGLLGFLSDVGHVSVWISHGCLSPTGAVQFCEDSQGIVLSSTAYWPNPGAAAIPAELFFLGTEAGANGRNKVAWNQTLAAAYPDVQPAHGSKYLGRAWRRSMRVLTFRTSVEEDRSVLAQIEAQRLAYHYSYSHRNCAYYAEHVLRLYLGNDFHASRVLDVGVATPRALERALHHRLASDPDSHFQVIEFKGSLLHRWRQPPRNFCESAIFDPKYAIPLLMYQPFIYVGFSACYGATLFAEHARNTHPHTPVLLSFQPSPAQSPADQPRNPRLLSFEALTGPLPETSRWYNKTQPREGFLLETPAAFVAPEPARDMSPDFR